MHLAGFGKYDGPEFIRTVQVAGVTICGVLWGTRMEEFTTPATRSATALLYTTKD